MKDKIKWEYADSVGPNQRLLVLALNEAEALAWQTPFPQLVFPALAEEKATNLVRWFARQQAISPAALLLERREMSPAMLELSGASPLAAGACD